MNKEELASKMVEDLKPQGVELTLDQAKFLIEYYDKGLEGLLDPAEQKEFNTLVNSKGELSQDELEAVAGGGFFGKMCAALGIGFSAIGYGLTFGWLSDERTAEFKKNNKEMWEGGSKF